eukprot:TRINITY_DN2335_c3_g1_i1.p1 TRINITY_DN2335_c3_g1~~TRINITY_DN2335_c3_g1_i1.p1  ORF type:complete len:482 (-),score=72.86 TRINITY_DN2335_c3_g1_i1:108-1394(-)
MACDDHDTCGTVLGLCGYWGQALFYHLRAVRLGYQAGGLTADAAMSRIIESLSRCTEQCNEAQQLSELLQQVLLFWDTLELPWERLESHLGKHLSKYGPALVLVLVIRSYRTKSGKLPFTPSLYLTITVQHVHDLTAGGGGAEGAPAGSTVKGASSAAVSGASGNAGTGAGGVHRHTSGTLPPLPTMLGSSASSIDGSAAAAAVGAAAASGSAGGGEEGAGHASLPASTVPRVTVARLWQELTANLDKDVDKRMSVQAPVTVMRSSADSSASTPSSILSGGTAPEAPTSTGENFLAFTCGHHFLKKAFFDNILPAFQKRVENLSQDMPLTTQLFVADYKLKFSRLACPICLYNSLRQTSSAGQFASSASHAHGASGGSGGGGGGFSSHQRGSRSSVSRGAVPSRDSSHRSASVSSAAGGGGSGGAWRV